MSGGQRRTEEPGVVQSVGVTKSPTQLSDSTTTNKYRLGIFSCNGKFRGSEGLQEMLDQTSSSISFCFVLRLASC